MQMLARQSKSKEDIRNKPIPSEKILDYNKSINIKQKGRYSSCNIA